jgi:cytochrome c biogenesis protein CcmG/thiol:disulfide interchange protein DsbE
MSRRSVYAVLIALAFVGLLTFGLVKEGSSGPRVGDAAPLSTFTSLEDGGTAGLDEYRGRWVLVNFWASWCEPCKEEAPALQKLQTRFEGEDFTVIGMATRDVSDDSRQFVREFKLTYPQFRDGDGKMAQEWGTTGVPESFLIDPDGVIQAKHPGAVDEEMIESQFVSVLEANGVQAGESEKE